MIKGGLEKKGIERGSKCVIYRDNIPGKKKRCVIFDEPSKKERELINQYNENLQQGKTINEALKIFKKQSKIQKYGIREGKRGRPKGRKDTFKRERSKTGKRKVGKSKLRQPVLEIGKEDEDIMVDPEILLKYEEDEKVLEQNKKVVDIILDNDKPSTVVINKMIEDELPVKEIEMAIKAVDKINNVIIKEQFPLTFRQYSTELNKLLKDNNIKLGTVQKLNTASKYGRDNNISPVNLVEMIKSGQYSP